MMNTLFKNLPKLTFVLICSALFFSVPQSARADHLKAIDFVADLGERAVGTLSDKTLTEKDKTHKFREMLLEGFDVKTLGRFAVGRYWKKANKEQRSEYRKLFADYIVQTYAARFGQYSGVSIKVEEERAAGKRDIMVKSHLIRPDGAPVRIDWRVRERKHKLLIIDIIVEGVSMAISQRDEFSSVIRRGGGHFENLLVVLKDKIKD